MPEPLIKTGIYKHYKKGDLYFVEKTFPFKQSGKEDVPSVYYYPLYEVSDGCGRSISEFIDMVHITIAKEAGPLEDELLGIQVEGKTVKRFELVKELGPEYCKMLLPGSHTSWIKINDCRIERLYLLNGAIFIDLSGNLNTTTTFLNNFLFSLETVQTLP